ncbi:MAG TPA: UDP-N-acetylmuramoyl-L-alanine--D-glutamate ligase, partial [Solirubrobacteraceae bacterium]|nr:UDP-N-acetylmuramoyl-L-alanine--D-glutamate ligase [Solirubrobacteraceae bacterium]
MKPRPDLPSGPYLVVGLARSGIAAALALRARGDEVIGVDAGEPTDLDTLATAGVELHTREQGLSLLARVSAVVKSPGVPAETPVIVQARARDMCVMGELELAWRMLPNEFIAVTGTNGKTTTVELIGHIHRAAGLPVAVAGNVGVALSGLVGTLAQGVTIVCEASSFQLEDAFEFAPEAAVLLNLTTDHLDRHGTIEAYLRAKLRVFARQDAGDLAVVPLDFESELLSGAARRVRFGHDSKAQLSESGGVLHWDGEPLLDGSELRLQGRHNLENAMAAAAVCLARGLEPGAVRAGLRSFAGVPHRLEEVARRDGVLFVNDSKATNVTSTLVALDAMACLEEQGQAAKAPIVHLILGGQGKGQDFRPLRKPVRESCRAVYLIGEDASSIAAALESTGVVVRGCGDLERAVAGASAAAERGEVVLLSPGCASFDQFADFEARGER